jgi:hypothetical protein
MAPLDNPAACLTKKLAGGLWMTILYVLSGFTQILHGNGTPSRMSFVRSLKSLQKAATLIPL